MNIAVLVSGGGSNLQALLDAEARGELGGGRITLVISTRRDAYALERARRHGVPSRVIRPKEFATAAAYDRALCDALAEGQIQLVVLAGYLSMVGAGVLRAFPGRIVNIHPSLIPAFCGKGFYGLRVHEAALARGVKLTGATVHLVDEIYDHGAILLQKAVAVLPSDTPEVLQQRVMEEAEWVILPQAVAMLCQELAD